MFINNAHIRRNCEPRCLAEGGRSPKREQHPLPCACLRDGGCSPRWPLPGTTRSPPAMARAPCRQLARAGTGTPGATEGPGAGGWFGSRSAKISPPAQRHRPAGHGAGAGSAPGGTAGREGMGKGPGTALQPWLWQREGCWGLLLLASH